MRNIYIFFFLLLTEFSFGLTVSVNTYKFYAEDKPYLDVYMRILANSIKYKNKNDLLSSKADVTITIEDEATKNIVAWEKYRLNSPELREKKDLIDQKRFLIPTGNFLLKLKIVDALDSTNNFAMQQKLKIVDKKIPSFSDIELLTSVENRPDGPLVKNGIYMEPFPFNVVNETQQTLHFYTELYHKENALLSYGVYTGDQPSDSSKVVYIKYKKLEAKNVTPILYNFDLNKLPTGDYHLRVALIDDKKKEIISQYAPFINMNFPADIALKRDFNKEVENSFVSNFDSIKVTYGLKTLASQFTSSKGDILKHVIKEGNLSVKKYFLFKYWKEEYPNAPQQAYETYMKLIASLNDKFYSTVGEGYRTDRGHIFLKYGAPSKVISIDDEIDSAPYEIWFYEFMPKTNQNNVRFIFSSPSLANEYNLLHSTCIGEKKLDNWEEALYKNAASPGSGTAFNRKAKGLFEGQ